MHAHTDTRGRLTWASAIIRLKTHFTGGMKFNLVIRKQRREYGHTWYRMSQMRPGVIKQQEQRTLPRVRFL